MLYLYKILSLGFAYPEAKNLDMLGEILQGSENYFAGDLLGDVGSFKEKVLESGNTLEELQSEYLSVFDVGGKISPYETEYLREKISRKPFEIADIAGFYHAFGFSVNEEMCNKEPVDHIAVEMEFMAILAWKEEYARKSGQTENEEIVNEARKKFLSEHLARWGFFFCKQIQELDSSSFYKELAKLLEAALQRECRRYDMDPASFAKDMVKDSYGGVRAEELTCGVRFSE
ncbi:MAG: molecular chaperone TorD family protein [Thermodesulfovibrionales bacterium]